MKNLKHLFTALLLLSATMAFAEEVTINGIKYDVITKTKQAKVISGRNSSGDIVIPERIEYDGVMCDVADIDRFAFSGCSGLTSITIPNSVTGIWDGAFSDCTGLTSITIPNSVTDIGMDAFYGCKGLTSVTIPNSVTYIGNSVFRNCTGLTSITVSEGNTFYDSRDNCNAIIETETNTLVAGCKNTEIPNSVTGIGDGAFSDCTGLTSISIPNSVTTIRISAFRCSGLTSITIPNSITRIDRGAFYGCSELANITVSEGNAVYDSRDNCNAIIETETNTLVAGCKNTIIPNSVTTIGNSAFSDCTGLTSISIPNSVTNIGMDAFYGCKGLTSIEIPNSVTSIGGAAFCDCIGLTSITIPNSVTSIGFYAFSYCSGLTNVTIGSGVNSIYLEAFSNCENLTDVYCLATTVPNTELDAFYESYPEYMTLHVPAEAINEYKATAPWSSFGTIVAFDGEEIEPEVPEVPEIKVCATPTISYSNGKLSVECETEGAEFVTDVTCGDIRRFYDSEINFSATYNITVYATATGYENSETVNATLCWIENGNIDNETNVINVPATALFITSRNGELSINCALDGESVEVYTTGGALVGTTTIENGNATIQTGLSKGSMAIVKIGDKSVKVIVD